VRCRSGVEHPWIGALKCHLVQGGNETRLVPATWRRVAGGRRRRRRHLRRCEGSVCLRERRHGKTPLLLWAPGPRVEADPWAVGRGTGLRSTLGTLAAVLLLVAATAATTTATVVAAAVAATLAALALALATATRLRG